MLKVNKFNTIYIFFAVIIVVAIPHNCLSLPTSIDTGRGLQPKYSGDDTDAVSVTNSHDKQHMQSENITSNTTTWRLITRSQWKARKPDSVSNFTGPSPYVILHHSYQPGVCRTEDACKAAMRSMQNFHMDGHGWPDIGYSFAVGGDGNVYEARGYNTVGAHAPNYNSRSIGLLLIGNFMEELPPPQMLHVAQEFIRHSVEIGELREDYILHGHRQVRSTDCPGEKLYAEIRNWPHWQEVDDTKKQQYKN